MPKTSDDDSDGYRKMINDADYALKENYTAVNDRYVSYFDSAKQ